jgi:hypothetical protein
MSFRSIAAVIAVFATIVASAGTAAAAPYVIGYAETKSLIANMTMMSYDRGHGTQVEFIATNGRTYLLYPGNEVIVKGEWKLDPTDNPKVFNMCFRYPKNSYNPSTGQSGGKWECLAAGYYLGGMVETAAGDVLGLSKGVPFVLSKRKTSLARLIRLLD